MHSSCIMQSSILSEYRSRGVNPARTTACYTEHGRTPHASLLTPILGTLNTHSCISFRRISLYWARRSTLIQSPRSTTRRGIASCQRRKLLAWERNGPRWQETIHYSKLVSNSLFLSLHWCCKSCTDLDPSPRAPDYSPRCRLQCNALQVGSTITEYLREYPSSFLI